MTRKKVDYTDFKDLRDMAMRYARVHGLWDEQLCEDFGQEYCLAVWLGQHNSLSIQFANFLRKYYGRTDRFGSESSRAKAFALQNMEPYKE